MVVDEVYVQVWYFLMFVVFCVDEQVIVVVVQFVFVCDFVDCFYLCCDFFGRVVGCEIVECCVWVFWNYQNVVWCLWVDVFESKYVVIFEDFCVGNFGVQDFGEDVVFVVGYVRF